MKKVLIGLFALVSMNVHAFNGTIGRGAALSYDGTVDANSIEKQSINVKNSHSGSIPAGSAVTLDLTADDGASVIISATAGLSPLCIMETACAVGAICACQTNGKLDSALFDVGAGSAVAGKRFYMSSVNAGYLAARAADVATEVPGGIFYDAAAASGSVQVYIKL